MADNIAITPGLGVTVSTEEITTLNGGAVAAQQVQRVALASRTADGVAVDLIGSTANGLAVDVTRVGGVAPAFGTGVRGATVQRVTVATDDVVPVSIASVPSHAVTNAGTFATQAAAAGDVASGSADSGNPIKVGGKANSAEPTAVTNGQRVNAFFDLVGRLITSYSNPENMVSGAITTAMTATTTTSLVAAPGAGLRNYITTIIVSNAHATVGTDVIIQDGSGGTTLLTIPAAAVYGGAVITLPTPLRQPTANTALFCANVTTGASTKVSAVGYKGV